MLIPFLLFLITILLLSIFWELTKINSRIKKALTLNPGKAAVTAKTE
jgi:hypothetical protein